jgi:hypothetical protein
VVGLILSALVGAALWLVLGGDGQRPAPLTGRLEGLRLIGIDRPFPAGGRFASDPYVGSRVCAECHPGESALHARSGHAITLRPAGRLAVDRRVDGKAVDDPEFPSAAWSFRYRDGHLYIARRVGERVEECVAEYAFGSGHHATTFVNIIDPATPAILEHRFTYFSRDGAVDLTPGHEIKPPPPGLTPHGGVPPPRDARNCFGCHATEVSAPGDPGIDEARMIPNVSCERCHGPGRAHVEAARRGAAETELSLPQGTGRWTAAELLRSCGECHRHPNGPRPDAIRREDPNMARFQPIGLMQSRCYRESAGALSCVNCHDPHARASADRAGYDAVCMTCHRGPAEPTPRSTAGRAACPVSPRGRCVECHMPRVAVDPGRHILLSDHWIRVRREGDPVPAQPTDETKADRADSQGP